jgi:hypothetical protein
MFCLIIVVRNGEPIVSFSHLEGGLFSSDFRLLSVHTLYKFEILSLPLSILLIILLMFLDLSK